MLELERASKKQRELLVYIEAFIKNNGFGPSYREVMRALGYKSVSTVATHIDGLILKGYLQKRDHSARSLEVISSETNKPKQPSLDHIAWLRREIATRRSQTSEQATKEADVLHQALTILDHQDDKQV